MFDGSFTSDVAASYDMFEHNFRHANDWAYKFDLILAYTYTIDVYDAWNTILILTGVKLTFAVTFRKWKRF